MQAPWWWSKTETCRSEIYVYFNVNFNVLVKLKKLHLLLSELYVKCICLPSSRNILCVFLIFLVEWRIWCEFWSSNNGDDKGSSLLVCMFFFWSSVLQFPTFRRIVVLPSSGLVSVTPKTYHETGISMRIIFTYYSCLYEVNCNILSPA